MAADTPAHFERVPVDLHGDLRNDSEPDSHDLVNSLYCHLIQTCHFYIRALSRVGTAVDATKQYAQQSEDIPTIQLGRREPRISSVSRDVANKTTVSAEELPKEHAETERSGSRFADAVACLMLWGDTVSAGKSARLESVSQGLYRNVLEILHDCGRALQELRLCLDENLRLETEATKSLQALDAWLEKTTYMLHDSDELSRDAWNISRNELAGDSIADSMLCAHDQSEIIESFEESVTMLMDLSPTIGNALALQIVLDVEDRPATVDFTVTDVAQVWIARIAENYKSASNAIVQRLGEANWQRYCRLRAPKDATIATEYSQAKSVFHGSVAAEPKNAAASTIFHDSALGPSVHSATDYASSSASHSSFASINSDSNHHFHRVPPEPGEVVDGEPFVCPLCTTRIYGIRNRIHWK